MKKFLVLPLLAILIVGCTSLSKNVFRAEQTAVSVAYDGYVSYTNWLLTSLASPTITPEQHAKLVTISNDVKVARLKFAATVGAIEAMRVAYDTNSALKGPLEASITTLIDQSSNLCWLIQYYKGN